MGVVDWELAQPRGLPACDLFFFLANAAFALHRSHSTGDYLSAFDAAFFQPQAWGRRWVRAYGEKLGLPYEVLTPLFTLCWARYTDSLLLRTAEATGFPENTRIRTAAWLRGYRYYALWKYALVHRNRLRWDD